MRTKIEVRDDIDGVDKELVALFVKRFGLSAEIKIIKATNGDTILDEGRWQQVLDQVREEFESYGITDDFGDQVWEIIHTHSIKIQEE